jgi:hypothetical protein
MPLETRMENTMTVKAILGVPNSRRNFWINVISKTIKPSPINITKSTDNQDKEDEAKWILFILE